MSIAVTAILSPTTGSLGSAGNLVEIADGLNLPGFIMKYSRNEEIYGEAESAEFIYRVVSGAVRLSRLLDDGRRQIQAFHVAGDVFGLEDEVSHGNSAEAVCDCQIAIVKKVALKRAALTQVEFASCLWEVASEQLRRSRDHLMVLGRSSAAERVLHFLRDQSSRSSSGNVIRLPMSRLDIADYLGLTIETVSRTLTSMERQGDIQIRSSREITLHTV